MKSMKGMKFKTRRQAVFFLDFMIFMPFMVKCFVTIHHLIKLGNLSATVNSYNVFHPESGLIVLYAKFRCRANFRKKRFPAAWH